jgi:uncharacterized protein YllA (UPF0747 family)
MKGLELIEDKLMRAAKHEQEQLLHRLDKLHATLFPDGGLQERRDNFIPFFLRLGPAFFDTLLGTLDPLDKQFAVLELDQ